MQTGRLPLVLVLATGGTIAARASSSLALAEYQAGTIAGSELVDAVPELLQFARVRVEQVSNISSSSMTFAVWRALSERIHAIFADDDVAGIVITHGTNTIEETAYFLNLTVKHDRPVVLVGSMRPAGALSADGPLNLVNAVRVAISKRSRGRGVLVVLNDEINAARDVTKSNTYRVETFRSGELGFLGYVDQDNVTYYRAPEKRHTSGSEFELSGIEFPKVEILYSYVEADTSVFIDALTRAGVRGIIFAAAGAGMLSDREKDAVRASPHTIFVRASRVPNGRVISHKVHDELGIIPADNLSAQKARILLMLALTRSTERTELKRFFEEY